MATQREFLITFSGVPITTTDGRFVEEYNSNRYWLTASKLCDKVCSRERRNRFKFNTHVPTQQL